MKFQIKLALNLPYLLWPYKKCVHWIVKKQKQNKKENYKEKTQSQNLLLKLLQFEQKPLKKHKKHFKTTGGNDKIKAVFLTIFK